MPNLCSNDLVVVGPYEDVKRFVDAVTSEDGSISILDTLYPVPQDLKNTVADGGYGSDESKQARDANVEKYGYPDWYEWCCDKWGTKWGDYDDASMVCRNDDPPEDKNRLARAFITFTSAWCPPDSGIAYISTLFPTILFDLRYEEEGMGFHGVLQVRNGERLEELCVEYIQPSEMFYDWARERYEDLIEESADNSDG
jgi:hypothetical protein